MNYEEDIGKFVTLSYKKPDGEVKLVMGKLEIDENGFLLFINLKDKEKSKRVNPKEIVVVDYSAEPIEVKGDEG